MAKSLATTARPVPIPGRWKIYEIPDAVMPGLLLTVLLLPPLPLYLGIATSMALGTTLAAAIVVFVCWLCGVATRRNTSQFTVDFGLMPSLVAVIICVVILIHAIVADGILVSDMTRSIESFIPLVMMVFAAIVLGRALAASSDRALRKSVVFSFWVLLIVLILQVLHLQPRPSAFPKSTFPFTETSHFVLAFTPVLMFICVSAARRRSLAWLLLGFSLGVFVQSLALIMGCMIMTVASRRLLLVTLAVIAVMAAGLPFGKEYFATRLDFTGAALNLSNLVYIQGWELIPESFLRSSGWGVGFQQLGFHGTNVPAATLIHAITDGDEANLTDGSFVFSKLASEFGVAGVFLGFLYLYGAFRSIRALRRGADRATIRFAHCVVAAYGVDMFVRGTGYFVESTFLFLAAVSALSYNVEDRWLAVTRSLLLGRPRQPST